MALTRRWQYPKWTEDYLVSASQGSADYGWNLQVNLVQSPLLAALIGIKTHFGSA